MEADTPTPLGQTFTFPTLGIHLPPNVWTEQTSLSQPSPAQPSKGTFWFQKFCKLTKGVYLWTFLATFPHSETRMSRHFSSSSLRGENTTEMETLHSRQVWLLEDHSHWKTLCVVRSNTEKCCGCNEQFSTVFWREITMFLFLARKGSYHDLLTMLSSSVSFSPI